MRHSRADHLSFNSVLSSLLISFLVFLSPLLSAQTDSKLEPPGLQFELVELPGGGTGNGVSGMVQDSVGFLWFGSAFGLHRYDGHHFKTYIHDQQDPNSISHNHIEPIHLGSKGKLWIGTTFGGLNCFDPETEHFIRYQPVAGDTTSLSSSNIWSIAEDLEGNIWVGTTNGLNRLNRQTGKFRRFMHQPGDPNSISNNYVCTVYCDKQGTVWVGTGNIFGNRSGEKGGLNRYHPETETFEHYLHDPDDPEGLKNDLINCIYEDAAGRFWVSTNGDGLHLMDRNTGTFTHFPLSEALDTSNPPIGLGIRSIVETSSGKLWLGIRHGGIKLFDPASGKSIHYWSGRSDAKSPTNDYTWNLFQTRDSSLWIATGVRGGQVNKLYTESSIFTHHSFGFQEDILALDEDQGGILWVGTKNHGLIRYDQKNDVFQQFKHDPMDPHSLQSNMVVGLEKDGDGQLWVITKGRDIRLQRYDPKTQRFIPLLVTIEGQFSNSMLDPEEVTGLCSDRQGGFWLSLANDGLVRTDQKSGKLRSIRHDPENTNSPAGDKIYSLISGKNGMLWFAGRKEDNTLFIDQYDPHKKQFTHYSLGPATIPVVYSLEQDDNGTIWFVIYGGIIGGLDPHTSKITYYTFNDGQLPFSQINYIKAMAGNLWIGSHNNFSRFSPATGTYFVYNGNNTTLGTLGLGAPLKASGDRLFFPNRIREGYSVFTPPKNVGKLEKKLKVHLTDVFILNQPLSPNPEGPLRHPVWETDKVYFAHSDKSFTFHFSCFDFRKPAANQYEYQLDGYDHKWRVAEDSPSANYTDVSPGSYTFRVRAVNKDGIRIEQEASFKVTIRPPWWRTTVAYVLYLLLLIGMVWGFLRWRLYSIRLYYEREAAFAKAMAAEEANAAKSAFLSTVSHELRTPLTSIIGFTKLNKKNLAEKVIPEIKEEAENGQRAAKRIAKNLSIVESEGRRLTNLINDLLDLAKIESGKLEWKMVETQPAELIRQATTATTALLEEKQELQLFTEISDGLPSITADRDRIIQVLINLISNAVKFTDSGFIKIGARETPGAAPRELTFFVEDSGSGIPADQLDQVFERFRQVVDNQAGKPKGTGLGLPICKEIVEHHGGKIWVESDPDSDREEKGSTFFFTLPIQNNRTDA